MPGVIMGNGDRNGPHTNHDRGALSNGINGAAHVHVSEHSYEKNKSRLDSLNGELSRPIVNGIGAQQRDSSPSAAVDINRLPPEIKHVTLNFQPLSGLLSRLAQVTHNRLSSKILELASMPTPSSAWNGNGAHYGNGVDDNSVENIRKKVQLLKFVEETHANWTKALVITQWSRVADDVSKMIDLTQHLNERRLNYLAAIDQMGTVHNSLAHARLPNPDLKTAVEVLSTGKASWMPDLGYLEPPPLTAKDLLRSLQDLNTLLSIRLNMHEYDRIPPQFQDYSISSGRVTFRVADEFEVDLTIADNNPETQFWFIDFRFLFTPSIAQLPDHMRYMIENKVNAALERDGLAGCYKFLHELVLTHKIAELRRQAFELSRGRWIETLQVEPLQRALSIQYWFDRYGKDGPKSWVIIGITSGRTKGRQPEPKESSRISIRWFRDSKEVKDVVIPLNLTELSTEAFLREVINRHIFHILSNTHSKLQTKPLFANRLLSLSFRKSEATSEPELMVQLTTQDRINIAIEPISGRFAIHPASRLASQAEWKLNSQTRDPSLNAHEFIENLRCVSMSEAVISRALSVGWIPVRTPPGLKQEDLKPVVPRDTLQLSWFRRPGWSREWFVALSSSMSGERWWLIETTGAANEPKIRNHFQIPVRSVSPDPTHAFLSSIHLLAAAMVTYFVNQRSLHERRAMYRVQKIPTKTPMSSLNLPSVIVSLDTILLKEPALSWAADHLRVKFQGVETLAKPTSPSSEAPAEAPAEALKSPEELFEENAIVIAEGHMSQPITPGLLVKQRIDKDIAFHPTSGAFAFRLQSRVGVPAINSLTERLGRVRQLVQLVQTMKRHDHVLSCDAISLGKISFTYKSQVSQPRGSETTIDPEVYRAIVDFSGTGKPLDLILEEGNPHIRILDILVKILNSNLGLEGVATMLPLTLPVLRSAISIEDYWSESDMGTVEVFNRAADWYVIRYTLIEDVKTKHFHFSIRLQHRKGKPWWCVRREHNRQSSTDEVDVALKTVWDDQGTCWRGMQNAGIAEPAGAEELLARVDIVVREVARSGVAWKETMLAVNSQQGVPGQQHGGFNGNQSLHETIVID